MRLSQILLLSAALGLSLSCSEKLPRNESSKSSAESNTNETQKPADDERATPPTNVTGSYMYCEKIAGSDPLVESVGCSLKRGAENVDVATVFKDVKWTFDNTPAGLSVVLSEVIDVKYQIMYVIKATDGQPVADRAKDVQFAVNAVDAESGESLEKNSSTENGVVSWVALTGNEIPANAIPAGSENHKTMISYICRIHKGDQIILGKILKVDGTSVCFTNSLQQFAQSASVKTGEIFFKTDILVLNSGRFEDVLEWVDSGGIMIPVLSVVLATDPTTSELLMSCRQLDNGSQVSDPVRRNLNDKEGEYQVGEFRHGKGCFYNYIDNVQTEYFQTLAWKNKEIQALMKERLK